MSEKIPLMTADELQKITLTEEDANKKQVRDFAEGMFQDIHKRATQMGRPDLIAPVTADDKALPLVNAVIELFKEYGFEAELIEEKQEIPVADGGEPQEVVVSRGIKVTGKPALQA